MVSVASEGIARRSKAAGLLSMAWCKGRFRSGWWLLFGKSYPLGLSPGYSGTFMRGEYFSYGLLAALAIALLIAAFTDIRTRKIDNRLNLAVALGAPLFWWATGLSLWPGVPLQLGVAVACFAFCCIFFALNWMGGGDVKLLTALALWFRPLDFLSMFMLIAIIGLVLTVVFGAWHIARRQKERVAIPYGIAIAGGGLWAIGTLLLPALQIAGQTG